MGSFASALLEGTRAGRFGVAVAIALGVLCPSSRAADVRIPTCPQFVEFGRSWIGLDEDRVSRDLGLPLYQLTNADIDRITQAMKRCLADAATPDAKAILTDEMKHVASLRAARDRVSKAFSTFEAAKKKAAPKLAQLTAKLDSLKPILANRAAVGDAEAAISGIFFNLEELRNRAQVREKLTESFQPYMDAQAAITRKRQGFAESARLALVAEAEAAYASHRAEFERLKVPEVSQEATIVLEGADGGSDVRWLTLRQWASLVLKNSGDQSLSLMRADPSLVDLKVVRQGYGDVIFTFREAGRELHLVRTRVDGVLHDIVAPDDRQGAISQLIAVAKSK